MKLSLSNIIFGAVLILLVLLFITALFLLNRSAGPLTESEKEQALTKILGRQAVLKEKQGLNGDVLHQGKYVSFLYPAGAKITVPILNGTPIPSQDLEDFYFSVGDNPRVDVVTAVTTASAAETGITDDPSVRIRQTEKDIYKQVNVTADNQNGLSFTKSDQALEKTAFFFINNRIYSFSVSGSDQKNVTALYNKIILSLKFL